MSANVIDFGGGLKVKMPADMGAVIEAAKTNEYKGYAIPALAKVFDAIAPKPNWKMPIAALIPVDLLDMAAAAADFYGAGKLKPTGSILPGWKIAVEAPGYYAATGA